MLLFILICQYLFLFVIITLLESKEKAVDSGDFIRVFLRFVQVSLAV